MHIHSPPPPPFFTVIYLFIYFKDTCISTNVCTYLINHHVTTLTEALLTDLHDFLHTTMPSTFDHMFDPKLFSIVKTFFTNVTAVKYIAHEEARFKQVLSMHLLKGCVNNEQHPPLNFCLLKKYPVSELFQTCF